ncbi:4-alpha-glucanotransferase [Sphingomonas sp. KR1UV-12]|uniref:4-alpha-glucanotransferase n=1 Tax=Sphingomonas aurea TaxID=3063994 RepID=A0ABT9EKE7_9SPHN|nr:4-alpha-glucanotransferase [Sphingomonas sp. KR1UV-12]MDP1027271.1 4-alpha-glucanotransferase [Sphingomonas sp. KR1UV-12]
MSALHQLAEAAGLQVDWTDAGGQAQRVSDDALVRVLDALGYPAGDDGAISDSRARLAEERASRRGAFVSTDVGAELHLPDARGVLVLDDGTRIDVAGGVVPAVDRPGYHRLLTDDGEVTVAVAPARCFAVGDAAPGRRVWGPAVQIAGLRDARDTAFGDFGTLARTAASFGEKGADLVGVSPVHALFPADAGRYSPYAPSSRLFLNILYADPAIVGLPVTGEDAPDLIDWASAIPQRLAKLRAAYEARPDAVRDAVAAFAETGGEELLRHARFDALHAHFLPDGAYGWQAWPEAFHDPAGAAVAEWARANRQEVDFYLFCQWLADRSLAEAQKAATDAGMALGLIADLAVGMDAGGSHAWSRPEDLITGLSIGAPPDILGPEGQNWGITGFSPQALAARGFAPFRATIRAALAHAGGIRIDHAMGLQRLWVVPDGCSAAEGAYLSYPVDDMLRVLAIESHAARAVVIGEDLGTVPEGFRPRMDARGMLGMRVMPFEMWGDDLIPPDRYNAQAAAMTGTHDLPTMAGWWCGRDMDWAEKLGRGRPDHAANRREREAQRAGWWRSFTAAGVASGEQPAVDDPEPVVDAAIGFVGQTPCDIVILPIEDVLGLVEQPNLPGTMDEHPNWRRRMPGDTAALLASEPAATHLATINATRLNGARTR